MPGKQPFTVLIRVPDAVDSDRPIYLMLVNATSLRHAWLEAVRSLITDLEVDVRDLRDDEDQFQCIALFRGHQRNLGHLVEIGNTIKASNDALNDGDFTT